MRAPQRCPLVPDRHQTPRRRDPHDGQPTSATIRKTTGVRRHLSIRDTSRRPDDFGKSNLKRDWNVRQSSIGFVKNRCGAL